MYLNKFRNTHNRDINNQCFNLYDAETRMSQDN